MKLKKIAKLASIAAITLLPLKNKAQQQDTTSTDTVPTNRIENLKHKKKKFPKITYEGIFRIHQDAIIEDVNEPAILNTWFALDPSKIKFQFSEQMGIRMDLMARQPFDNRIHVNGVIALQNLTVNLDKKNISLSAGLFVPNPEQAWQKLPTHDYSLDNVNMMYQNIRSDIGIKATARTEGKNIMSLSAAIHSAAITLPTYQIPHFGHRAHFNRGDDQPFDKSLYATVTANPIHITQEGKYAIDVWGGMTVATPTNQEAKFDGASAGFMAKLNLDPKIFIQIGGEFTRYGASEVTENDGDETTTGFARIGFEKSWRVGFVQNNMQGQNTEHNEQIYTLEKYINQNNTIQIYLSNGEFERETETGDRSKLATTYLGFGLTHRLDFKDRQK